MKLLTKTLVLLMRGIRDGLCKCKGCNRWEIKFVNEDLLLFTLENITINLDRARLVSQNIFQVRSKA